MATIDRSYYEGKSAVVTGAASGFGLGFCERLLELGASDVWMGDYDESSLLRECGKLNERFPGKVHAMVCDCSKKEDVDKLIDTAARESGHLDFLFNNAGRPMTIPFEHLSQEGFRNMVELNYFGVVYGVSAALPYMMAQGHGHVVNTASCGGLLAMAYQAPYASTKAAVIALTRCLDLEYGYRGIRFTALSPSNVATNIFKAQQIEEMRLAHKSEEEIEKATGGVLPPSGAIPLDEALDYVFEKLPTDDVDIVFGQEGRDFYALQCSDYPEYCRTVHRITMLRKDYYDAMERGERPEFPG